MENAPNSQGPPAPKCVRQSVQIASIRSISAAISGVTGYTLSFAVGIKAPACGLGTVVYSGPAGSFLHEGLQSGVALSYRLCATDAAGNVSTGLTRTVTPL